MLFATTRGTPDPNTIGVVAAYPAAGCGKPRCEPPWTGSTSRRGPPRRRPWSTAWCSSARGPPASPRKTPPTRGWYAFKATGCGTKICMPVSFLELSTDQDYLGAPLAVGEGKASDDNVSGRSLVYAMGLPG